MATLDLTNSGVLAGSPFVLTVAAADVYAGAGSGKIAVIRHIFIVNESGAPVTYDLWTGTGAVGGRRIIGAGKTLAAGLWDEWEGNFPLGGTQKIRGSASAGSAVTVTVTGYVLI